jgi:hypothetical protein
MRAWLSQALLNKPAQQTCSTNLLNLQRGSSRHFAGAHPLRSKDREACVRKWRSPSVPAPGAAPPASALVTREATTIGLFFCKGCSG